MRSTEEEVLARESSKEVLARESSNQEVLARESSNQALAKRVKQSRSLSGVTASKESWPEDWLSKQGVLAGRLAEQAGSLG